MWSLYPLATLKKCIQPAKLHSIHKLRCVPTGHWQEKEKHFLVVHSWISDEAKREILTPPEERDPPQKRKTEREWAQENASREDASVVQHWITTEDFFYCHWIARNEQDIYKTLEKWGVEGTKINSMASEAYEYVTAFRSSETVFKKF